MDDEYGADDALLAAMAKAADDASPPRQPVPQRVQRRQPAAAALDRRPPQASSSGGGGGVVQPTPQALPQRPSASAMLVSPRQRGNPVLASLRSVPWEYSDVPADYVMGLTTCALFLR